MNPTNGCCWIAVVFIYASIAGHRRLHICTPDGEDVEPLAMCVLGIDMASEMASKVWKSSEGCSNSGTGWSNVG
jgi:hypothetical protein